LGNKPKRYQSNYERYRYSVEHQKYPPPKVIAVDVDGTLWHPLTGELNIPLVEWCRERRAEGFTPMLWSARGKAHAEAIAEQFSLVQLFDVILSKPGFVLDDQGWNWIVYTRVISLFSKSPENGVIQPNGVLEPYWGAKPKIIGIDVDKTLWFPFTEELNIPLVEWCREQKARGFSLMLWSSRGKRHAEAIAERFNVFGLFDVILSKPGFVLDELGWTWVKHTQVIRSFSESLEADRGSDEQNP
jgi:hypothetical protein